MNNNTKGQRRNFFPADRPTTGIVVDASTTPHNPGFTEYRGMDLETGRVLFHTKLGFTSNNIGEFLAIINALSYCETHKIKKPIYSDSYTALAWVSKMSVNSHVQTDEPISQLVFDAITYLRTSVMWMNNEVKMWITKQWGEIPADFGRKN